MRFFCILLLLLSMPLFAAYETLEFPNDAKRNEFTKLTHEIRCVTCQNQSIAESNAPIANDLRRKIHAQLLAGKSSNEIKRYLVTRYGDSILFSPPFNQRTLVLWLSPFILLVLALSLLYIRIRRCHPSQ